MLKVFKFIGSTLLAVFIIVLILPYFISLNTYKTQIQDLVFEKTGRELTLKGDIKFRVLPRPYVKLKDIKLKSSKETEAENLVEVDSVEVNLSILPLLTGKVSLDEIVLKDPKLFLEKQKDGSVNWDVFSEVSSKANDDSSKQDDSVNQSSPDIPFHLSRLKIYDGKLSYKDPQGEQKISDLNLDVRFDALTGPFDLDARFEVLDQEIELSGRLEGISGVVPVDMTVKAFGKTGALSGTIDLDNMKFDTKLLIEGRLTDLKTLLSGMSIPDHLKKTYTLRANLEGDLDNILIKNLKFELGPLKANGAANIDVKKMIGGLKVRLMPGEIDFDLQPTSTNPKNLRARVSLTSKNTKQFLQALQVNLKDIPAYLLQAFSLKTKVAFHDDKISLSQINLDAGKAKLNGDVSVENLGEDDAAYTFDVRTINASALAALFGAKVPSDLGSVKVVGKATGKPKNIALNADVYAANAKTNLAGKVVVGDKAIRPTLRLKSSGKNLRSSLQSLGGGKIGHNLGAFSLNLFVSGDFPQRLKLKIDDSKFSMNKDQLSLTGNMDLFLGRVKPKLSADLSLSSIDLDRLLAYLNGQKFTNVANKVPTPKTPKSKWSHEKIDLTGLRSFDGDISIKIPQMKKGSLVFDTIKSSMRVANGVMDVTSLTGNLYGGTLDLKARVSSQKGQPITLTAHLKNAKLQNITPKGKSIKVTKGDFSLDADLTTSGHSEYQYVANLSGALNFRGTEGEISGFNLSGVIDRLQSVRSVGDILAILNRTFSGGTSAFKSITATSTITNGTLKLTKFDLDAIQARITAEGTVSLLKYIMAINSRIDLAVKNLPAFDVYFHGPLDNPKHTIKAQALQAHLIQNVLTGVTGAIQEGGGSPESIVKGILGLGGSSSANDNNADGQTQQGSDGQRNQNTQQKQQSADDPLGKAVEGLLNNLF